MHRRRLTPSPGGFPRGSSMDCVPLPGEDRGPAPRASEWTCRGRWAVGVNKGLSRRNKRRTPPSAVNSSTGGAISPSRSTSRLARASLRSPERALPWPLRPETYGHQHYNVAPDGKHFVVRHRRDTRLTGGYVIPRGSRAPQSRRSRPARRARRCSLARLKARLPPVANHGPPRLAAGPGRRAVRAAP